METDLPKFLGTPRFNRYLTDADGDFDRAVKLYVANIRLSGAAIEAINIVEVALRNAFDAHLRQWNRDVNGVEEWTTMPAPDLRDVITYQDTLKKAKDKAERAVAGRREVSHDDVLAHLSFGTWYYLMPSTMNGPKRRIWNGALKSAFPYATQVQPERIKDSIQIVYDLRNRVAHFEPIYDLHLAGKRSAMKKILHLMNRPISNWFADTERLTAETEAFYADWPGWRR